MALPQRILSGREVRVLFHSLDSVKIKFERLALRMRNGVTAFSELNPALALMAIYAFSMVAVFMMLIVMAFMNLAAGTDVLETVLMPVMEGLNEHVLPALQLLNGLLASLMGFSILLDCLNTHLANLYVNRSRSRISRNKMMSTLSRRSRIIRSLPKAKHGCLTRLDDVNMNAPASCAICLECIREEDEVRILPNCRHYFHVHCIDRWLLLRPTNSSCPLCRVTVISNDLPS